MRATRIVCVVRQWSVFGKSPFQWAWALFCEKVDYCVKLVVSPMPLRATVKGAAGGVAPMSRSFSRRGQVAMVNNGGAEEGSRGAGTLTSVEGSTPAAWWPVNPMINAMRRRARPALKILQDRISADLSRGGLLAWFNAHGRHWPPCKKRGRVGESAARRRAKLVPHREGPVEAAAE